MATDPDIYVNCPYFPEHVLRQQRLPYHLLKCQHAPNAPKLFACPYNYLHRVKPEDKEEHILICQDRPQVRFTEKVRPSFARTQQQLQNRPGTGQEKMKEPELPEGEEEWW